MAEEKDRKDSGFTVTDRRTFTREGDVRENRDKDAGPPEPPRDSGQGAASGDSERHQEAPALDFSSFLLSLATTALVHLGDIPDPATGSKSEDLSAARQMIDILGMLEQKTEGNRTSDETRLLSDILYELRMKAMSRSKVIQL